MRATLIALMAAPPLLLGTSGSTAPALVSDAQLDSVTVSSLANAPIQLPGPANSSGDTITITLNDITLSFVSPGNVQFTARNIPGGPFITVTHSAPVRPNTVCS